MKKNISAQSGVQAINWSIPTAARSLRVRLALWALLLVSIIQAIAGGILYLSISAWLENQVDTNLRLTAAQVLAVLYDPADRQALLDPEDLRTQFRDESIAAQSFLRDQLFFVRLIDRQSNRLLAASAGYPIPLPAQLPAVGDRFDSVYFAEAGRTHQVRVYTVSPSLTPQYALQVGVSLEETHQVLSDMRRVLLFLLAITAILALLSGWFLANRALAPIGALARAAAAINEIDLAQRLDPNASEIELEQLLQTFNNMLDRLESAFQRQRQFTANAAHELRTPLSIMQAGLELTLSQERTAAAYHAAIAGAQEEVLRLVRLVNALLLLARTDAQTEPLVMSAVDLSFLLEATADQFAAAAGERSIKIERHIAPNLLMQGDEVCLIQVMINLLDNAVKYTPPGGTVTIIARQKQAWLEISIEDTGGGIPESEQELIFDRFYRVDEARSRQEGGFGLGLPLAKRMVELHKGQIELHSEAGRGALFVVTLPES